VTQTIDPIGVATETDYDANGNVKEVRTVIPQPGQVGPEVRDAFARQDPSAREAFAPGRPGKWLADLYALARQRLEKTGIMSIHGGSHCTFSDSERFFSHRRDGETGRMASLIWLAS